MSERANLIVHLDRNLNNITKYFNKNSLQCISVCSGGFNLSLEYLKVYINDKEIKLFNTVNGVSIGNIKFNIPIDISNDIQKLHIEYKYINNDNLTIEEKELVNKFPKTYMDDCYLICDYIIDYTKLIKDCNNSYELKNSLNKNI